MYALHTSIAYIARCVAALWSTIKYIGRSVGIISLVRGAALQFNLHCPISIFLSPPPPTKGRAPNVPLHWRRLAPYAYLGWGGGDEWWGSRGELKSKSSCWRVQPCLTFIPHLCIHCTFKRYQTSHQTQTARHSKAQHIMQPIWYVDQSRPARHCDDAYAYIHMYTHTFHNKQTNETDMTKAASKRLTPSPLSSSGRS